MLVATDGPVIVVEGEPRSCDRGGAGEVLGEDTGVGAILAQAVARFNGGHGLAEVRRGVVSHLETLGATMIGGDATDQLGKLYVGTIHGYCFRLLHRPD